MTLRSLSTRRFWREYRRDVFRSRRDVRARVIAFDFQIGYGLSERYGSGFH